MNNEKKLLKASINGQWCKLSDKLPDDKDHHVIVEARFIQDLLLGIATEKLTNKRVQAVKLRGAIIKGMLDLKDCSGPDGTPLPPLLLENCILMGDGEDIRTIDARHSSLRRLSLKNCKVALIDISDANVYGDFEINGIKQLKSKGQCQILACGCFIDGSVIVQNTKLKYSILQLDKDNKPDYALNLSEAEIKVSLKLQPKFWAVGGVNLKGTTIRGDIWAEGAKFIASKEKLDSFFAQSLKCEGVVVMRTNTPKKSCMARGQISFFGATLGFLDLNGIQIKKLLNRDGFTENVDDYDYRSALYLDLVRITNNFHLRNSSKIDGEIFASSLKVGGEVDLEISNTAILEDANIGSILKIKFNENAILKAKDLEVHGSVVLNGKIKQQNKEISLCFDGGKFHSEFMIDDLTFYNNEYNKISLNKNNNNRTDKSKEISVFTIKDAHIGHDFLVKKIKFIQNVQVVWSKNRSLKTFVTVLGFYPGWQLVELLYDIDENKKAIVGYLQKNDEQILLSGESLLIHKMNEKGHLKLTSNNVLNYLRFFCSYVWSDEGAFTIIESTEVLGKVQLPKEIELKLATIEEYKNDKWTCNAIIRYGDELFQAQFAVSKGGFIEMIKDERLAKIIDLNAIVFTAPIRSFTFDVSFINQFSNIFWRTDFGVQDNKKLSEKSIEQFFRDFGTYPLYARISLKGLKTDFFSHNAKSSWGEGIILEMDGFEYERIEQYNDDEHKKLTLKNTDNENKNSFESFEIASKNTTTSEQLEKSESGKSLSEEGNDYKKWLLIQFTDKKITKDNKDEFKPFPYEHLARILRKQGQYEVSKYIILEKLSLERRLIHDDWVRPFLWILEKWFDYGLFSYKSVIIFFLLWFSAWDIFQYVNMQNYNPPLMVINSTAVSPVISRDYGKSYNSVEPVMPYIQNPSDALSEVPCGDQIVPFWYSLDVMVPLLDLRQEMKCDVSTRKEAWGLRFFKNIFEVVGAIITSIMVLSVSGVLKRRIEQ